MIRGTSTGGLLAIMLGRLKMSIEDCEAAYLHLSENKFNPKRSKLNVASRSKDFLPTNSKFDAKRFEDAVKQILEQRSQESESLLLQEFICECRVFVVATRVQNSQFGNCRILAFID